MINDNENFEKTPIMNVYGAFGASLVFSVIPNIWAAALSILFLLGTLIAAYVIRRGKEEGSLTENHMTFIIRTIWIVGLLALVTLAAGSAYLLTYADDTSLTACVMQVATHMSPAATNEQLATMMQPCLDDYISLNFNVLVVSGIIAGGPILIYLAVRFARGVMRAMKGYRIANVKGWF